MAVTQYIGSRYVPLFADPIDWDITRAYEPLTIVYYQGNSYTSKQAVPTGIDVTNTTYWAITGNYNAQVEQYRYEVQTFDGRITANAQAIADEVTARMSEDTAIRALITTLNNDLETEESARETADTQIRTDFAAADTQIRTDFAAADAQVRADFAAADTALGSRIDATNARVTVLEDKPYIAVVGDSFSDGTDEWPGILAENTGYKILNGAVGASMFGSNSEGKQFILQLRELAQNANWSKVKHLIVYGCVNDWQILGARTGADTNPYVNAFIAEFKQLEHKPEITFVIGNCGAPDRNTGGWTFLHYPTYANEVIANIREQGYNAVPAYAWLLGYNNSDVFKPDLLHPSALGEKIIASKMQAIVDGGYNGLVKQLTMAPTNTNFNGKCVINIYDTYVSYGFKARTITGFTSQSTDYQTLFRFGKRFWFGVTEDVTSLALLHEHAATFLGNHIRTFSNIGVGLFGYKIKTNGTVIDSGFDFSSEPEILPFE